MKYNVKRFIFSSSATVYGDQPSPLKEDLELRERTNPYGKSKAMSERILTDAAKTRDGFSLVLLRYFNPVGAHSSGLIGEAPQGRPNNLMPYKCKVAKGELEILNVFGDDFETPDGTGIRDYIHVVDLARGHVAALEKAGVGTRVYNLGTGRGTSVLELVETFKKVNRVDVAYRIAERRPGDLAISFADVTKAKKELDWEAELGIEDMVRDAWNFENALDD